LACALVLAKVFGKRTVGACLSGQVSPTRISSRLVSWAGSQEPRRLCRNARILPPSHLVAWAVSRGERQERKSSLLGNVRKSHDKQQSHGGHHNEDEIAMSGQLQHDANTLVEDQLDRHLLKIQSLTKSDVLTIVGDLWGKIDELIRDSVEEHRPKQKKLSVILETDGGYAEVAERIARTLRKFYRQIAFIVPNYAMSAGTILVMSGDEILMDYFAILGPIDPQVRKKDGSGLIPVNGYLSRYNELLQKGIDKTISTVELTILIEKFDQGELYRYQKEKDLSEALLKEWLVKYKFKKWKRTKTHHRKVTRKIKIAVAARIAEMLNDSDMWHVHSRGIPINVVRRKLKLDVEDFGKKRPLSDEIRCYMKLLADHLKKIRTDSAIHMYHNYSPIYWR